MVAAAWALAARHDVRNEYDVMLLVGLCRFFGADFVDAPSRPWARALLDRPRLSGTRRVRDLWARMRAEGASP